MDRQEESSCTFDPNLQAGKNFLLGNEPQQPFDQSIYHSTNPFDVNYIPTGLDSNAFSPPRESSKLSLIQNLPIYTTSRSLEEKHKELRRNAHSPIDPDFNLKLQEKLDREARSDKENHHEDFEISAFEDRLQSGENSQNFFSQKSNLREVNIDQDEESNSFAKTELTDNPQALFQASIDNFLKDPISTSMKVLQNMTAQQQKELAQTLEVIKQCPSLDLASISQGLLAANVNFPQNSNTSNPQNIARKPYQKKNVPFDPKGRFGGSMAHQRDYKSNHDSNNRVYNVSNEKLLETIEKYQINTISLLNEVSTKVKKRIDYNMKDIPAGKARFFECCCCIQKQKIGQKRGSSKQNAKTGAAEEALYTLINNSKYTTERMTIIAVVQRMTGQTLGSSKVVRPNNSRFHINLLAGGEQNSSSYEKKDGYSEIAALAETSNDISSCENEPVILELNNVANQLNTNPIWYIQSPTHENDGFEAGLLLQDVSAKVVRETKIEAIKAAASEVLEKIRSKYNLPSSIDTDTITAAENIPENVEKVQILEEPKLDSDLNQQVNKNLEKRSGKRRFFETCLEDEFFADLQNDDQLSKEAMQKTNSELEHLLCSNIPKYQSHPTIYQSFYEIFERLKTFTSSIIEGPKPELADGEIHLTEYINQYHLVPVGSFALECMRNDELILDALFIYKEIKEASDLEVLELYQHSLERSQSLKEEAEEGELDMKFKFKVKSQPSGNFLEIEEIERGNKQLKVRIYLSVIGQKEDAKAEPFFLDKYNYSILHIKRILKCFDGMENQIKDFRRLLLILRSWRDANNLHFLRTEILDIILLREFFNNKASNYANSVINCLMILSCEETLKNSLSQFDSFYSSYYLALTDPFKSKLFSACSKTLNFILNRNFKDAKIFREI